MDEQVEDLVSLLAGRRAMLVGHSYGGNVALATVSRHPGLVRAVAMYETPAVVGAVVAGVDRRRDRARDPCDARRGSRALHAADDR
jgi:pimeloyl-ACP methyl ester carboxylesterase